ncbi:uncharacterized protein B0P05DRAFT_553196 [Gilbertella persicaria]|uniref:uncharacterized protein n=1 Tax=Gilbertella persicaria TaxID=101096 RepID=UPI00221F7BAF|nr:uncharacterized protein B0P05DRAFT_553196 [Gilbertella persicaria]KAI8067007.1 hypothetical protein B0P05DRAFT_553196 [Gilbertella persicaria]
MFTYSHALVTCLKSLGLADVIYTANTSVQVHIDESLFMIPNITHMSFGSVSFYLFCCLDWHRAFMQLKPFWPSENPLEIKKYNRLALRWMQQLNQNKTWLNYVPLEPVYFTECAGPLMQKTMLALTLAIMEHLIQHDFKTHLPAAQHLNRENVQWTYETYSHVFQEIEHHPQDVRKKQFEGKSGLLTIHSYSLSLYHSTSQVISTWTRLSTCHSTLFGQRVSSLSSNNTYLDHTNHTFYTYANHSKIYTQRT